MVVCELMRDSALLLECKTLRIPTDRIIKSLMVAWSDQLIVSTWLLRLEWLENAQEWVRSQTGFLNLHIEASSWLDLISQSLELPDPCSLVLNNACWGLLNHVLQCEICNLASEQRWKWQIESDYLYIPEGILESCVKKPQLVVNLVLEHGRIWMRTDVVIINPRSTASKCILKFKNNSAHVGWLYMGLKMLEGNVKAFLELRN